MVRINDLSGDSSARAPQRALLILFFFSGASSLIFETIFTRLLTYTFGNTAYAVSTVLAAFLGGLALGALLFGRFAEKRKPSVRLYGLLELLIALYSLFIPRMFAFLTPIYVEIHDVFHLREGGLIALRFALAVLVILTPTVLMGGTLPVLARIVAARGPDFQSDISRLYSWNTFGAAIGTVAAAYVLIPTLGIWGTILCACGINLCLFLSVLAFARFLAPAASPDSAADEFIGADAGASIVIENGFSLTLLTLAAFLTGAVALAYEVLWTHVLAFLIGNTVYAFGVMLFSLLCGLGWGALIVARRLQHTQSWALVLAASQLALAFVVFLTLPLWNHIPDLFAGGLPQALELDVVAVAALVSCRMFYAGWKIYRRTASSAFPWNRVAELTIGIVILFSVLNANTSFLVKQELTYFYAGELFRFLCALCLLIVPSLLLGLSFPLLLNLSARSQNRASTSVGNVYAANTLGAITGSLITGFYILPWVGSYTALRVAGAANLILGLWFAIQWVRLTFARKTALAIATACIASIAWFGPSNWDQRSMTRGSYVYFTPGWPIDQILYFKEDVQGGLTSVIQMGPTRVLLSNGKFQGNNTGEVGGQIRFATIPLLFTQAFDRALVIGLGTGNTLRAVSRFPFRLIDTVELAPSVVAAARQWFDDVNERVFDKDERVHLSIADGRNFLLLSHDQYDLITIEVSSIWISGEADLYNKEFYEVCRTHMKEHGVLQQWVQIHHMRTQDFLVILNTAAHVFPHTAFFLGPEQGVLIASSAPLTIDAHQVLAFDSDPGIQKELGILRLPSMAALFAELVLHGESMHHALSLLPKISSLPPGTVSTDYDPYLEYQTPKGNAVPYDTAAANARLLVSLRPPPMPPDIGFRNAPTPDEARLFAAYVNEARGERAAALELFRSVQGPDLGRAQQEIARIESLNQPSTK